MKSNIDVLEIMQMLCENISHSDQEEFELGYGKAVKDLAKLIGKDAEEYGIIY